ncbi:MAG: phosphopyruvate hydratase [Acidiferrobacterales bacterium]
MRATGIAAVRARRVWDSRGRPTVEAEVQLAHGVRGRAIAPAGASTGSGEAVDLRDGGEHLGGYDVSRAIANVNDEIAAALKGADAADQAGVDEILIKRDGTQNKHRLGANACVAVSMATAHAAATATGVPLWRYLLDGGEPTLPLPEIQIFGGGAHAGGRVDVQDFLVVAAGAESFEQALAWTAEVYHQAGALIAARGRRCGVADEGGWWPAFATNEEALDMLVRAIEAAGLRPGEQMAIALDIAASQFGHNGRYRLGLEDRELGSDELAELIVDWIDRYPIISIEDPFAEDDEHAWIELMRAVGERVQIVGDDLLVTNAARIRQAAVRKSCNAVLLKPNQAGTLTETRAAFDAARAAGFGAIVSARSGESEDVTIVHLAVGWGVRQLKVGSFSRSERMAKWNEALRIEEALGPKARFAEGGPFRFRGPE